MTGWRLGWIVAPPALMPDLGKLIEYNTSCSPAFVQRAGVVAIDARRSRRSRIRSTRFRAARDFLVARARTRFPASSAAAAAARCTSFFRVAGVDRQPRFLQAAGARSQARPRARQRVRARRRGLRALVLRGRRGAARRRRRAARARFCERQRFDVEAPSVARPLGAVLLHARARHRAAIADGSRSAADMNKTLRVALRSPRTDSIRRRSTTRIRSTSAGRSSIRSTPTIISRARCASFPTPPTACRRSPTAAAPTRCKVQARHLFRRRSRVQGQEARADRRGLRLQHQAHLRPEGALVLAVCVRASSGRASTRCSRARARPAASTTTRRSRACRRSTATRCASGSRSPTTRFAALAHLRRRSPPSRARSSRRTRTRRTA